MVSVDVKHHVYLLCMLLTDRPLEGSALFVKGLRVRASVCVWGGGGRRGEGKVIPANRDAKQTLVIPRLASWWHETTQA